MNYYNEFNPESAAMLRQMVVDGIVTPGEVDERSITEVTASDLKGYTQCHFFAGIGGWSIALRLAGWPDDRPVWTGSAPCQPFSSAGRQKGKADERHLFPCWLNLIRQCRPPVLFGEQVASSIAHGWLDDVYQGLEAEGYAIGAAVLPACSVGAPHRRDRLWFVAHANSDLSGGLSGETGRTGQEIRLRGGLDTSYVGIPMANAECGRPSGPGALGEPLYPTASSHGQTNRPNDVGAGMWGNAEWLNCPDQKLRLVESSIPLLAHGIQHRKPILHAIGNAIVPQVAAEFIRASLPTPAAGEK